MTFQAFDTLDEMHAHMREAEAAANAAATTENWKVKEGSYAMSFDTQSGQLIFGRVWTIDEIVEAEAKYDDPDVSLKVVRDTYTSSYARGYRFANWHSAWMPEGELGDNHVSRLLPITEEQFEEAFLEKFNVDAIMHTMWAQDRLMMQMAITNGTP